MIHRRERASITEGGFSRRDFLRVASGAALTGLAACAGPSGPGSGAPDASVPETRTGPAASGTFAEPRDGSCPAFDRARRPDLLVVVTDDQRYDMLGCAGHPFLKTPVMDRLARDGVRFTRAFVTTPICAASRASILTGLTERTHGYTFTKPPLGDAFVDDSYPALLRVAGYHQGFVGKFGVKVPKDAPARLFDRFEPTSQPYRKERDGTVRHLTDLNADRASKIIAESPGDRPLCLSLSFWAPHAEDSNPDQYVWPASCDGLYDEVTVPPPALSDPAFFESKPDFVKQSMNRKRWHWRFDTEEKYQAMVKGYCRMITGVDQALGRVLEAHAGANRDRDLVVILIGDNGYFLGERGFAGKWTMHDLSIRVPFIVYDSGAPGRDRGQVRDEMVLNLDIKDTLLALAGAGEAASSEGRSLTPLLRTGQEAPDPPWRTEVRTEHLWDHPEIPRTEAVRTDLHQAHMVSGSPGVFRSLRPVGGSVGSGEPCGKIVTDTIFSRSEKMVSVTIFPPPPRRPFSGRGNARRIPGRGGRGASAYPPPRRAGRRPFP